MQEARCPGGQPQAGRAATRSVDAQEAGRPALPADNPQCFDLLVVGAGIQGATAACEASRRGLSVLLVDRGDFGAGASANSMHIAHGGLRYLQGLDLRRSLESIRERRRLLRVAHAWVRPLPCRMHPDGRSAAFLGLFRVGLALNDLLSWRRNRGVPPEARLPRARGLTWYDALIEDTERVLVACVHSALLANPASRAASYAPLEKLEAAGPGRPLRARVGGLGEVQARVVLDCTGATRPGGAAVLSMNLVVDALPLTTGGSAVALSHADEGRAVFAVPWRGCTILGTHDRAYPRDPGAPLRVEPAWIDDVLAWLRAAHPSLAGLARRNVRRVHAGLLPADARSPAVPSGAASLEERDDGVIAVHGVKWTTAWGLSSRAVDRAARRLGRAARRAPDAPLADPRAEIGAYLAQDPEHRLPLLSGSGGTLRRGDVLFAVDREWALHLADVLCRRTGAAATGHPGRALVEAAAALLQRRLDWSEAERRREVEAFDQDFQFAGNVPAD